MTTVRPRSGDLTVANTQAEHATSVNIIVGILGQKTRAVSYPSGTTLKEVIRGERAEEFEVLVNDDRVKDTYVLKEGDYVAIVPESFSGG